jgi:uncharacterized protein (TIGR03435 family)
MENPQTFRRMFLLAIAGIVAIVAVIALRAQAPDTKPVAFEVATVKPNTSAEWRVAGGFQPGGRYSVTNYTLRALIAAAYMRPQVNPDFLISGGPKWIDADHFDVQAKAAEDVPPSVGPDTASSPRRLMLQALLAERFKLKVHHEISERPIYALVFARTDRKTGPQLRLAAIDCAAIAAGRGGAPPPSPSQLGARPACGMRVAPGNLGGGGVVMSQFASLLPRFVDRVVLDQTGLVGGFDLELNWTPAPGEWTPPPLPGVPDPPAQGPTLFTALQEQLGLKLESAKGPVDVLAIDHVEHPTEN